MFKHLTSEEINQLTKAQKDRLYYAYMEIFQLQKEVHKAKKKVEKIRKKVVKASRRLKMIKDSYRRSPRKDYMRERID